MSKPIIDSSSYKLAHHLAEQYADIQKKLGELSGTSSSDTALKWVTLIVTSVSVFIGLRIFYLTRSKEFTVKRGDICGEIFKCFFDYKTTVMGLAESMMYLEANKKFLELLLDEEYILFNYTQYQEDAPEALTYQNAIRAGNENVKLYKDKIREIRKDLAKHFGQYKFYITKGEKEKFNTCIELFNKFRFPSFRFTECKSETEVKTKLVEYTKEYPKMVRKLYKPGVDVVEAHLEEFN
jgi:hypothetical protein